MQQAKSPPDIERLPLPKYNNLHELTEHVHQGRALCDIRWNSFPQLAFSRALSSEVGTTTKSVCAFYK